MYRALAEAATTTEIMHNHSLWMMPNIYPAWAVRRTRCRLVMSPRGTLSAWALRHRYWRKKVFWSIYQGPAIRRSTCLHATSETEYEDIRQAGLRAPVAVIPNGIDIPDLSHARPAPDSPRRLLFLGRVHPKKGVDILIKAWRRIQDHVPDWELHVVGPDNDGHLAAVQSLVQAVGAARVFFPGPVYGEDKNRAFQQADLFVLPTHSENFGLTVAEALANGVPVVVSKGAPWAAVEQRRCGWWVDIGEGPLAECLGGALRLSREELRARGARGRLWMAGDFSWSRMGRMMHETYLWLLGGGSPPAWIRSEV